MSARAECLPGPRAQLARVVVAVAGLFGVSGLLLAYGLWAGDPLRPGAHPGVGQSVNTSFGVVAVEGVQLVTGHHMSGPRMTNMLAADKMQVQVTAAITNLTNEPVEYSPRQFRLKLPRTGRILQPTSATIHPGRLQPQASLEAQINFVMGRSSQPLQVVFEDPASERLVIDLGNTRPTSHEHHH